MKCATAHCDHDATHECNHAKPSCAVCKSDCCRPIIDGALRTNLGRAYAAQLRRRDRPCNRTPLLLLGALVGRRFGARLAWDSVPINLLQDVTVHLDERLGKISTPGNSRERAKARWLTRWQQFVLGEIARRARPTAVVCLTCMHAIDPEVPHSCSSVVAGRYALSEISSGSDSVTVGESS